MSLEEFKKGLSEQYQGELVGEMFFSELTKRFDSPQHQYQLATLLQLETETAARLRPTALEFGAELHIRDEYHKMLQEFLRGCEGMSWNQFTTYLEDAVGPFVKRYIEIAETAPPEFKALAESMVVHEKAIQTFARLEASGLTDHSLDEVIGQLNFPLKRRP